MKIDNEWNLFIEGCHQVYVARTDHWIYGATAIISTSQKQVSINWLVENIGTIKSTDAMSQKGLRHWYANPSLKDLRN